MPDYKKTEQLFKEMGISHLYKKPMAQLDDELFYAKVTNPETNQPYQWADLDVSYRKHGNDKKYPTRQVNQIVHVRRADGSEWLKSRGLIVALDKAGNEVKHSFTDPEVYYEPIVEYGFKPKDPKNPEGPKERVAVNAEINETDLEYKKYTLPFNAKNFDALFKQRPNLSPTSASMVIMEEGVMGPRAIDNPEAFKNTPFEDLWQEAITPKYKLDRSYNDTLEASHIK